MKLASLLEPLAADIAAVARHHGIDPSVPAGKTGLATMHGLLAVVSRNRAYDDNHPGFRSGGWPRILPYDGRDYCFYYVDGANDDHLATLLRAIQKRLTQP